MQLMEEDELTWNDGSANPEPCLDDFPLVTTVEILLLAVYAITGRQTLFSVVTIFQTNDVISRPIAFAALW